MASNVHQLDTSKRDATINLGAGPSSLPTSVLLEAAEGLVDFQGTGMGLTELSHRSSTFKKVVDAAEADLRKLLDIPDDYAVLFTQGGGTEQFSATALNLVSAQANRRREGGNTNAKPTCDYVVTGSWTAKAVKEAKRLGINPNVVVDARQHNDGKFGVIPPVSAWKLSSADSEATTPAMLYYCDNETVDGVEFPSPGFPIDDLPPKYAAEVPIVADCSSNILSRPIDVRKHSLIFFGAQKNVGPSGVTVVIVRRSLISHDVDEAKTLEAGGSLRIPTTLVYKNQADNASLYNTPPMFSIYVAGLVFRDLLANGGLQGATERATKKSSLVYGVIADSKGLFVPTVAQANARSRMNVTFRVATPQNGGKADEEAENRFVEACARRGIVQVKGHRSVGGIRCSLYNAVTLAQTEVLVDVMRAFVASEQQ